MLGKLLLFNPKKRLTAEEALEHPYVADFHNVEEEIVCDHKIRIPVDDNVKYGQEDYKRKLYEIVLQRKMEIRKQIMESIKKEKEMQMNNNNNNSNNNNNNSQNIQNNNIN